MVGLHEPKHGSNIQSTIGLSSGDSEFYSLANGAATGLGIQALACDFGVELEVEVGTDSSASIGISSRRGLGRTKKSLQGISGYTSECWPRS